MDPNDPNNSYNTSFHNLNIPQNPNIQHSDRSYFQNFYPNIQYPGFQYSASQNFPNSQIQFPFHPYFQNSQAFQFPINMPVEHSSPSQIHLTPGSQQSQFTENVVENDINLNADNDERTGRRQQPWTNAEDNILISAWLNISKDPITGADQKNDSFWRRIHEYCKENHPGFSRTTDGVEKRWRRINHDAQKFSACYDEACRNFRSGANEEDKIANAREIYCRDTGKNKCFADRAWESVRREVKWQSQVPTGGNSKRSKENASGAYTSSSNADTSTGENNIVNSPARPIGCKQAKRKGKKPMKPSVDQSTLNENYKEMTEVAKERQKTLAELKDIEAKKLELMQRNMDMELIYKDTSTMDEETRAWHVRLVKQIMKKYE